MEQKSVEEKPIEQENEYIIWRDETFRVMYRIKAPDAYTALFKLKTGQIDDYYHANRDNLQLADCVEVKLVDIDKVNKTPEEIAQEWEARGYAPNI